MSEWALEVDPSRPVAILARIAAIVQEHPGDDRLVLVIGDRRITAPVALTPQTRAAIGRALVEREAP